MEFPDEKESKKLGALAALVRAGANGNWPQAVHTVSRGPPEPIRVSDSSLFHIRMPRMRGEVRSLFYDLLQRACFSQESPP